jgi:hypothetical protein
VRNLEEFFTLLERVGSFMEAYYTHFVSVFGAPGQQGGLFTQFDLDEARKVGVEEGKSMVLEQGGGFVQEDVDGARAAGVEEGKRMALEEIKRTGAGEKTASFASGRLAMLGQLYTEEGVPKLYTTQEEVKALFTRLKGGGSPVNSR